MTRTDYRPRTGTELIDVAFQLLKGHFSAIITIVAIGCIPELLVHVIVSLSLIGPIGANGIYAFVNGVTVLLLQGSLLVALSDAYLGRSVAVGPSVSAGFRHMWALFTAGFATSLLIGLAFLLLIIPGFIVFTWLFVVPALVVIEHAPPTATATLARSRMLCGDAKLRILGFGIIALVTMMIIGVLTGVVIALTKDVVLAGFLSPLMQMVFVPLYAAFVIVQYYDARIRKEGYDVELMASTLPSTGVPQPTTV